MLQAGELIIRPTAGGNTCEVASCAVFAQVEAHELGYFDRFGVPGGDEAGDGEEIGPGSVATVGAQLNESCGQARVCWTERMEARCGSNALTEPAFALRLTLKGPERAAAQAVSSSARSPSREVLNAGQRSCRRYPEVRSSCFHTIMAESEPTLVMSSGLSCWLPGLRRGEAALVMAAARALNSGAAEKSKSVRAILNPC